MMRAREFFLISAVCYFLCLISAEIFASEQLTITTYYPSPYGSYRELRAQRIAIGDNYIDGATYSWDSLPATIEPDADLVVEGRVGIGTPQPQQKLTVGGQQARIRIENPGNGTDTAVLQLADTGSGRAWNLLNRDNSNAFFLQSFDGVATYRMPFQVLYGAPSNSLVIDSSGRVGLGTSAPGKKLDVLGRMRVRSSTSTGGIFFANSAGTDLSFVGIQSEAANDAVGFWNSGWHLIVRNNGRVGIGTTNPTKKLEVVGGPIKATGGLIIETRSSNPSGPEDGRIWLIN
jgi:hypothetical protein